MSVFFRMLVLIGVVAAAHGRVIAVRHLGQRLLAHRISSSVSKARSVVSLGTSVSVYLLYPPSIEGRIRTESGTEFLRVKFRIWPGRGAPIETTLKQEIVQELNSLDPSYADWMVTVNYEVEKKTVI